VFYARINKIKIFNNREGFLGLFNRAEMRIYGFATGWFDEGGGIGGDVGARRALPLQSQSQPQPLTLGDLANLPDDEARRKRLLDAVIDEADKFSQSVYMEIDRVKDNHSITFGDAGLVICQSESIPDRLDMQIWVIESDADVRNFAIEADAVLDSEAFKTLYATSCAALAITNPILTAAISLGGVFVNILRKRLRANKDDLVGYFQSSLNRTEHYPHAARDRQDVPDTTGNILVDYTLFGITE
jgi:hypothetical protein